MPMQGSTLRSLEAANLSSAQAVLLAGVFEGGANGTELAMLPARGTRFARMSVESATEMAKRGEGLVNRMTMPIGLGLMVIAARVILALTKK